jgi:hypothetical protein
VSTVYVIEKIDDIEGYDDFLGVASTLEQAKERAMETDPTGFPVRIEVSEWDIGANRGRLVAIWLRTEMNGPGVWHHSDVLVGRKN